MSLVDSEQTGLRKAPHRVTWFPPERPVEGNTIYVLPDVPAAATSSDETQAGHNADHRPLAD
jgi:hypothetical protein